LTIAGAYNLLTLAQQKTREEIIMRVLIAATIAASLVATNLLAAEATAPANAPLAPGNAAGLKKAQAADDYTLLWILGGAGALAFIVGSMGAHTGATAPAAATTATTATTAT
jgi:hypothetical protein